MNTATSIVHDDNVSLPRRASLLLLLLWLAVALAMNRLPLLLLLLSLLLLVVLSLLLVVRLKLRGLSILLLPWSAFALHQRLHLLLLPTIGCFVCECAVSILVYVLLLCCCCCYGCLNCRCWRPTYNDSSQLLSSTEQQLLQLHACLQRTSTCVVCFLKRSSKHCCQHLLPLLPVCFPVGAAVLCCKGLRRLLPKY
jgi:hypothetical protein